MREVAPGVYTLLGLLAGRVYLTRDEDGLTLIDTGLKSAPEKIVRQITARGWQPRDVKRILITHAHPDHVGGLPELKRLTGAEVVASRVERPFVEGVEPVQRPDPSRLKGLARVMRPPEQRLKGAPVDRTVEDGEMIGGPLGSLRVVSTPGHTPGHIAFWQPERRVLFAGDVLGRYFGLRLPPAAFTVDMDENKRSLARLAELTPEVLCLGHGVPIAKGAAPMLAEFARKTAAS